MPFVSKAIKVLHTTFTTNPVDGLRSSQMAAGRYKKALEVQSLALEEAKAARAKCERSMGILALDELDTDEAYAELRLVEGRVRQLEQAVAVAKERLVSAELAIKTSEKEVLRLQLLEHLTLLEIAAKAHQAALDELARCSIETTKRFNNVLAMSCAPITLQITNSRMSYKARLLGTSHQMPGCQSAEAWFLKAEPWLASVPKPADLEGMAWPL